ncbi:MAG: hypothetical protein ACYTFN_17445 [Planctomycetota bacterium]
MEDFIGREVEMRKLGVTLQDMTWPMARARGYPDTKGVLVTGIRAGEPFEEAKPKVRRVDREHRGLREGLRERQGNTDPG